MTGVIATIPRFQFSNALGVPLAGGKLHTYLAGTTSPAPTYQDQALTIANQNPVPLDARGECVLWLDPGKSYKFVLKSALGLTQWTQDNVIGALASNQERPVQTEVQVATDSQTVFKLKKLTYTPGINSLKVYVDGFRLSGAEYMETDRDTVTFRTGLRKDLEVLFETGSGVNGGSAEDASMVPYLPPGPGAVPTNVADELAQRVSVRGFGATGNGSSSDQVACAAAVAYAYQFDLELDWPAGTYVCPDSIPHFHEVTHTGRGVIKRGSATYAVRPKGKSTQVNTLYVATTGSVANDGLSVDAPMATIQQAFDALKNAGQALAAIWQVSIAAGTYNAPSSLSNILFMNQLRILGPAVAGGVPTAIIDGTGLASQAINGMLLSNGIYALVRDLKFTNWNGGSGVGTGDASTGLNVSIGCNVWADNVHADLCGTAVAATRSRIYQGRGLVSNCDIGSTAFANTTCSYGYGGATTYSNCPVSINIRDGSAGVVDGGMLINSGTGIKVTNQSHTRVSNCTFTNSSTADVYLYTGSSCFFGTGNTYTPGKRVRGQFAMDLDNANRLYYDGDTNRFNFGEFGTPGYPFHFRSSVTGSFASSAATVAVEADSPLVALNGGATGTFGLLCAIPGTPAAASLQYTASDGNWRVRVNNVDSYRMASTTFRAVADNAVTLGLPSARFSTVYAGTGAINTSDEREKGQVRDIEAAALRAVRRINFKQFKFNHAVQAKGDDARWHFGVIAQEVQAAFEAEGLDPFAYGLLCYDEWGNQYEPVTAEREVEIVGADGEPYTTIETYETGEMKLARAAGNRYGVRYDELLCLKFAALTEQLA